MVKKLEAIGLLDLTRRHKLVDVGAEQKLEVYGLSAKMIVELFERFPPLQTAVLGMGLKVEVIKKLGPEVMAALIAAATGNLGNEEAEVIASDLPIEIQWDIIDAMGRVTFTNGYGPFYQKVKAAVAGLAVEVGKIPVTNSARPSPPSKETSIPTSGT